MKNIDGFRMKFLAVAEIVDSWRLIPRLILVAYGYVLYDIVVWYKSLEPYIIQGCVSQTITDCIIHAPTTQQTALLSAVVGVSTAVIGLYFNTGRNWLVGVQEWRKTVTADNIQKENIQKENNAES